jgi:Spy/CpxP family protein refolding chaperone
MKISKLLAGSLLAAGLVLTTAAPALAQNPQRGAQVEKRIQQARGRLLRHKVGLDEKKAVAVEGILDRHAKERRTLRKQMREHKKSVTTLLSADSNDQQAYARAIAGVRATDNKLRTLRDKELDALAKVLTPKQQAKLVVAAKQLQKEIRSRMQRRKRRGRP